MCLVPLHPHPFFSFWSMHFFAICKLYFIRDRFRPKLVYYKRTRTHKHLGARRQTHGNVFIRIFRIFIFGSSRFSNFARNYVQPPTVRQTVSFFFLLDGSQGDQVECTRNLPDERDEGNHFDIKLWRPPTSRLSTKFNLHNNHFIDRCNPKFALFMELIKIDESPKV